MKAFSPSFKSGSSNISLIGSAANAFESEIAKLGEMRSKGTNDSEEQLRQGIAIIGLGACGAGLVHQGLTAIGLI